MSISDAATPARIHPTADVAPGVHIGWNTRIWNRAQIREGARVGSDCVIGSNVYVDVDVRIGDRVKVENNACVFRGTDVADGVFIGPSVIVANDRHPRAITPEGKLKDAADWAVSPVSIEHGASIGAAAVLLPGITIGEFAIVGAGAVVTRHVPPHALVVGVPGRVVGNACCCGTTTRFDSTNVGPAFSCAACGRSHEVGRAEPRT